MAAKNSAQYNKRNDTAGALAAADIAANAVTVAKLGANLQIGYVPLFLAMAREIASSDIVNTAGDAGVLSKDTTPIFERINGATDKKQRLRWAAANVDEIVWDFPYPPDLDDASPVIFNFLAAMGGATDIPVVAVSFFEGLGDTNAGGNSAAVTGTTIAAYSVSVTGANIGAYPNAASIGFVPAAHGTDTFLLYAAWVNYTRKT